MSPYITALVAGPYHVVRDHHDGIDLGLWCRKTLAPSTSTPTSCSRSPGRASTGTTRTSACGTRSASTTSSSCPEFNAGRDGERRLRDLPRGLRVPQQGHRRPLRAPRRDDPARDGAHVVRRSRDHALVGRPVAQRVVRRPTPRTLCQTEATRWTRRLDDLRQRREDLGLPAGPAALDAPDRHRRARRADRRGQLRRHHLRQGRERAQAARRLRRRRGVPRRAARLLRRARLRQHHAGRPARRRSRSRPAATSASGRKLWLETAGINTIRPEFEVDAEGRYTSFELVQTAPDEVAQRRTCCARTGWPSACYDDSGEQARCASAASSSTSTGERTAGAGAGRRRAARRCCWSTTTT